MLSPAAPCQAVTLLWVRRHLPLPLLMPPRRCQHRPHQDPAGGKCASSPNSPVPQNKPSSATNTSIGAHLLIEIFPMIVMQPCKPVAFAGTVVRIVFGHVHHCSPQRLMFRVCIPHFPRGRNYSGNWALCQIVFQCIQHIGETLVLVTSNTWLIL